MGSDAQLPTNGGLWELFIGVWLITKGFSTSSQTPSENAPGTPSLPLGLH